MLIYFDAASRRAVHANLHAALNPGGHLILGLSETMTHIAGPLEMARVGSALLYRKPAIRND
jgi:chemotaxis methyl-accepting protein methylase